MKKKQDHRKLIAELVRDHTALIQNELNSANGPRQPAYTAWCCLDDVRFQEEVLHMVKDMTGQLRSQAKGRACVSVATEFVDGNMLRLVAWFATKDDDSNSVVDERPSKVGWLRRLLGLNRR